MKIKSVLFVFLIVFSTVYIPKDVDVIKENLVIDSFVPRLDSSGNNTTAYVKYSNSTGTYLTSKGETTQLEGIGSSFQSSFAISEESNETHVWIQDPTNPIDGYYIEIGSGYQELNSSRGQTNRHWYNETSGEYTYSSDLLVNKTNVIDGTDWVTTEEFPNRFVIRFTNGSLRFYETVDKINTAFQSIDNSTLWAVGYESFAGVMGFYLNFADLDWGHAQYLYWPRLKNGQISAYNQPLYAIYPHLYANYSGTVYDKLLNDRSLYDTPAKNPHNTLHFYNDSDTFGMYFSTPNIDILASNWDFEHGFKYNFTDNLYHMISRMRCNDRDFEDIGMAYEITSSPQSDGTPYQPDRFLLSNETHSKEVNISQAWDAGTYLDNYYSQVEIISQNNESFAFAFDDIKLAGFTEKYLNLHDQQFPNGSIRKVLRAGMYGYGSYSQGTWIEIDPPIGPVYTADNYDLYKNDANWVTTSAQMYSGQSVGGEEQHMFLAWDTGINVVVASTSSVAMELYCLTSSYDAGEGLTCFVYNIGGNGDTNTAREDSLSYDLGTYWTEYLVYTGVIGTSAYQTADVTKMESLTDYWGVNRGDSEEYISFWFRDNQGGAEDGDYYKWFDAQFASNIPKLSFTYLTNTVPTVSIQNDGDLIYAGIEETTMIIRYTDADGYDDIDDVWIDLSNDDFTSYDIQITWNVDSNTLDVPTGSGWVIGTPNDPTESTGDSASGGSGYYDITWKFVIDWDTNWDETDIDLRGDCDDESDAGATAVSDTDAGEEFDDELIFKSSVWTLSDDAYSEDGNTDLAGSEPEWFRGGVAVTATGVVSYESVTTVYPETTGVDVELWVNGSDEGATHTDVTLGSSGSYSISAFTTVTTVGIDADYDFQVYFTGWSGDGDTDNIGTHIGNYKCDASRDNQVPTATYLHADSNTGDGYNPQNGYDDDLVADYTLYSPSDGSGSGLNSPAYRYNWDGGVYGGYTVVTTPEIEVADGDSADSDAQIRDNVGNIATIDGEDIIIDDDAPTSSSITEGDVSGYPTDNAYLYSTTIFYDTGDSDSFTISITSTSPDNSGFWKTEVDVDGVFTAGMTSDDTALPNEHNCAYLSRGSGTLRIRIVNNAGNYEEITYTATADNTAPSAYTLALVSDTADGGYTPNTGYYDDGTVNVDASSATEEGSGLPTNDYSFQVESQGWSGYQSSDTYTTSSQSDGSYDIYVKVVDNVGNEGTATEITGGADNDVTIDTDNPVSFTTTWTNADGWGSSDYAYLSGSTIYWKNNVGSQTFTVQVNNDGTIQNSGFWKIRWDVNSVFETWEDDTSGLPDSKNFNYESDTASNTFIIRVVNNAGNYQSITFTTDDDQTAPTTTFSSLSENPNSNYQYISAQTCYFSNLMGGSDVFFDVTVTSGDTGGAGVYGVRMSVWDDDSDSYDSSSPYTRQYSTDSTEISGSINLYTYDQVGNFDASPVVITMTEDLVITSIGLDSETESSDYLYKEYGSGSQGCYGSQMGSTQIYTIAGSASDSGSDLFTIMDNTAFGNNPSNGGSLSSWSFAYEIDSADNGDITVTYTVTDNVGNTDTTTYNFYEDNTAPTGFSISLTVDSSANIGYLPNTGYYDDDSVDVSVSGGSDALSGLPTNKYAYQRNALGYGSYTSSSTNTFTSVEDGSHTLYVKMRDNVYNEASPDSIGVVVDTDNPSSFTLTLSRLTGIEYTYYAYLSGSIIYFNSDQTDYFTVQVNDDGTIQNSDFWKIEWDKNSVFETGNNDSSGLPDTKNFNYNSDTSGTFLIRVINNAGNYQSFSYTATEDATDPTMTFGLFQDPYAFNFYSSTTCYTNVSSQNDGSSGLPTNFLAYKLNSGSYGSWNATTDKTWSAIGSSNNTLYAKIRDNVGNERIYSGWVYPDTTIPILGWLTINETYSPNWFDQTISTTVWIHVNWIESYPYHVNITISGSLTASDDLTPTGSSSDFYSTITGASDGSYSITIVIYDKAGNSDSTLIGSEAPIQLESGMSDDVQEFYYYFYLVQSDGGIGLVWRDFNSSYVLDEAYRNYTEVSLRGDFVGRIWLNQTSSIRIITMDWFGDVIYNQSFVLPPSKDKILVLAVNTFKVVNLFQGVINMTIEYPEVGSFNYTEQLMPNEIFSWILGATTYNITCMVHLENTYATDEQDNELNDFQVDLSLSDKSIFIDAVSTTFNIEVGSFSISDDFVNVFVTSSYDCSYTIYENDSSTGSGSIDKDGTSISHSRDTTAGAYIDLAYKFVYGSNTIWFNTTYSNSAPTSFTVNIGSISYSDAYVDLYALSSKNCDVYIYENDTLEGTTSISTTGASIRHNKDTTSGATILLAYKFSDGSTDIWYNTSYNNAEDPTIMPTWSNVFSNNSAVEFGESKIVAWFYNELADWEIWLNGSLEQTGTSSYPQYIWDTSSCSLAWYNFTLQVTSTSTATNSSYIRVQVADTTAPTITYDNSTVNNTNIEWGTTYNLSWSFSESCSYEILLNASSQTTESGTSVDWSLDTTDLYHNYWYNITIEVTDPGSNTISESLFFYNRDSISPAITIGFSSKTYYYSELGEHTFTWTVYDLHNYNASLLIDNVNTLNYTLDTVTELIIVTIIMELGTKNYKLTVYDSAGNYASDTVQITIVVSQTDGQGQPDPPTTPDTPDSLVEDDFLGKLLKTLPFLIFGIGGIVGLIVGIFLAKKFGLWGKFMEKVSEYL